MKMKAKRSAPLIEVLKDFFPASSITTLRSWIKQGRILYKQRSIRIPSAPIEVGTLLTIEGKTKWISHGIQILFEDKDLVVVYKPAGILSVATRFEKNETIHAVLKNYAHSPTVYPVHRLDRETSGLMVFAYSYRAKEELKKQFFLHTIQREYHALVEGKMRGYKGTWKSFLKEDANYFVSSHPEGKEAITHFKVLRKMAHQTALKLVLETGRKNQIRVHASEAGHPIVGDKKYGSTKNTLKRLGLHASLLSFTHPVTKKKMKFSSQLPSEFLAYFKSKGEL